ncbi:Outer membrane protein OprM [Burkholderia cepacia]|nr:Outer membrane protein OprM [Burkholderia cepacia]
MKFVRLVAALSAAAVLTACTSAPVATVTPPPLAATYANADLAAGGPAADTGAWWHAFHDPILDRLVDTALANNLDLQAAVARIDAARAVRIGAASQWFPSVDLNAGAGRQRLSASQAFPTDTPTTGNAFDLNASLAWEIDIFGRIRQGVSAADADIASAQNDAAAVRIATIDETVRTYVTVRGLEQRLALVEANASSQRSTEESTRRLFDAGVVPIATWTAPPRRRKRRWPSCPRCNFSGRPRSTGCRSSQRPRRRPSTRASIRPRRNRCGRPPHRASARRPTCCAAGPTCARPRRASSPPMRGSAWRRPT